jgi:hypothetical protein
MDKTPVPRRDMVPGTFLSPGALYASTLNDTNQNDHNRDDQESMNESAHGVRGNKTQNPEETKMTAMVSSMVLLPLRDVDES